MSSNEQLELDLGYMVACPNCSKLCTKDEAWLFGVCYACFLISIDA